MNKTVDDCLVGRANNFDFVRFMAALLVIFSHAFVMTKLPQVRYWEPLHAFSHKMMTFGGFSVAVFFIISGLLISQSFDRSKSILTFIQARILRIYPALIVTILLTVFVIGPILTTTPLGHYFTSTLTFKYLINVFCVKIFFVLPGLFTHNYLPKTVNGSLWTLPHELGCYCLVIAGGLCLNKKYLPALIILALVACVFWTGVIHNRHTFYFAIGALIYIYRSKIILNGYIALIALVAFLANLHFDHHVIPFIMVTGFTLGYLLMYFGFAPIKFLKNFSKRGDFSYGLYIWGFIVEQIICMALHPQNPYELFLISSCFALVFAILSWHLIEKRALKLKDKLKKRQNPFSGKGARFFSRFNIILNKSE